LQDTVIDIDREVSGAFSYLKEALEGALTSCDLIKRQGSIFEMKNNCNLQLRNLKELRQLTPHESEATRLDAEIASMSEMIDKTEAEFKKIEAETEALMSKVGELNDKGRNAINDVTIKNKPLLDVAILEYFDIFRAYSKQYADFVAKNGKPDTRCKKTSA